MFTRQACALTSIWQLSHPTESKGPHHSPPDAAQPHLPLRSPLSLLNLNPPITHHQSRQLFHEHRPLPQTVCSVTCCKRRRGTKGINRASTPPGSCPSINTIPSDLHRYPLPRNLQTREFSCSINHRQNESVRVQLLLWKLQLLLLQLLQRTWPRCRLEKKEKILTNLGIALNQRLEGPR